MAEGCHGDVLLERELELDRLREVVGGAAGGSGGLIVIGGPAGIGKTALLRAAPLRPRARIGTPS